MPPETPQPEGPTKYIRTFHADMQAVQEKGVADWTPLPSLTPAQPPSPSPELPAPLPTIAGGPAEPAASLTPPGLPELGTPARVETYANDFSQRMKATNAATASILAAEQDAGPAPTLAPPPLPSGNKNLWYTVGGVALLALGGAGVYLGYAESVARNAPVVIAPLPGTPIFVDERVEVAGTGSALTQAVRQAAVQPLAAGAVRHLAHATTTDAPVFSMLDISAPPELIRNLRASGSMAGVVGVARSQTPFFILSVTSYGTTFAAMLAWESFMPRYLSDLYPAYARQPADFGGQAASSTVATSTTQATTAGIPPPQFTPGFRDEVIANHDARVYRDEDGRSIVVYGYWDQATLVIARDPAAFAHILERLATSRS